MIWEVGDILTVVKDFDDALGLVVRVETIGYGNMDVKILKNPTNYKGHEVGKICENWNANFTGWVKIGFGELPIEEVVLF